MTGVRFLAGESDFSIFHNIQSGSELAAPESTYHPAYWVPGVVSASSPNTGVKRPGN
jgi:hypothetical protein